MPLLKAGEKMTKAQKMRIMMAKQNGDNIQ